MFFPFWLSNWCCSIFVARLLILVAFTPYSCTRAQNVKLSTTCSSISVLDDDIVRSVNLPTHLLDSRVAFLMNILFVPLHLFAMRLSSSVAY